MCGFAAVPLQHRNLNFRTGPQHDERRTIMKNEIAITIRTKKLAVLLRDARQSAGRTQADCAAALGIPEETYEKYERGENAPSVPELEALAYFLDVPVAHFWGSRSLSEGDAGHEAAGRIAQSLEMRRAAIGAGLRSLREEAGRSLDDLAEASGLSGEDLAVYEDGSMTVPTPHLELLLAELGGSIQDFTGGDGPVGDWIRERSNLTNLLAMPDELQDFVCKPYNRPYLEIAHRLSTMEVNKLRNVAEGLLEITL
jgi:transcriptional regulator with XRE-family HTH domain